MREIQFEVRTRKKQRQEFWSVFYDVANGKIKSIEPGQHTVAGALVVNYVRVKSLLAGTTNQNDFRVELNENLGSLDLVDTRRPSEYRKKQVYQGWLSAAETLESTTSPLRATLFADTGFIRFEASRQWTTKVKENFDKNSIDSHIPFFISDSQDPHNLYAADQIDLQEIIERGFWEKRLWAFADHALVQKILYQGQTIRINMPPVAAGLQLHRIRQYSQFSNIIDEKTVMSKAGRGKHITIFQKEGGLWAQSHYEKGGEIDRVNGNLTVAILSQADPDYFSCWAELPALMLRQPYPFELLPLWAYNSTPSVLYKANNLDIGVIS